MCCCIQLILHRKLDKVGLKYFSLLCSLGGSPRCIDNRRGSCWTKINNGSCEANIPGTTLRSECCCASNSLGKAWGSPCERYHRKFYQSTPTIKYPIQAPGIIICMEYT